MKILGYDEVDGEQVLELNIKAFGWFLSPEQMAFIRKVDSRVSEYVALYAVVDDVVQSQVGVVTWIPKQLRVQKRLVIYGVLQQDLHRQGMDMPRN
jgi:hypothetical protein